jgi:hypothetical protein
MKYLCRAKSEIRDDFIRTNQMEEDIFSGKKRIKTKEI